MRIAFVGTVGIPNRYGGFESFLEQCAPAVAQRGYATLVTCDRHAYPDDSGARYRGVERVFINVRANGAMSILHDLVAFLSIFRRASHIVLLGVSGGVFFPLFRTLCAIAGKKLLVNIDGIEWRRTKFSRTRRLALRVFDTLAQWSAHGVIYDNRALLPYVLPLARRKASLIAYSGDHVVRDPTVEREPDTALTICRIEPENNLDLIIEGALASRLRRYTIVGNWNGSPYGRSLRARYAAEPRLVMLDPVYSPDAVARHRERCAMYIHGHSVGGTNPSLVEILFYDCAVYCFDCAFNRETAMDSAQYFSDAASLAGLIDGGLAGPAAVPDRTAIRERYTTSAIATAYLEAMKKA